MRIGKKVLSVGCKTFNAKEVLEGLQTLKGTTNQVGTGSNVFCATREGVMVGHYTYVLPWPDADRLLAALVEYFKAKEVA